MNGWTPERRRSQAEAIRRWRPWEKSTGPQSAVGKAAVSKNAFKGGNRAKLRELGRLLRNVDEEREALATGYDCRIGS